MSEHAIDPDDPRFEAAVRAVVTRNISSLLKAEVDPADARFEQAVKKVISAQIPNVLKAERVLGIPVLVFTVLASIGVLGLAGWAYGVWWKEQQGKYIKQTVGESLLDNSGPLAQLSTNFQALNSAFRRQVDSAAFKFLWFGCTRPPAEESGFPACDALQTRAGQEQSRDRQSILVVANPESQAVFLDLSAVPISSSRELEPVILKIMAEAPPVRATANNARKPLYLKPEQLDYKSREFLQDGRLRLYSPSSGTLRANIELTSSLRTLGLQGPLLLSFWTEREAGEHDKVYDRASGTELFILKTVTYAYHSLPAAAPVSPR